MSKRRQLLNVAGTVLRDGPGPLILARRAIRDYGAMQRTWELQSLIGLVRRLGPGVILEIGTHTGGTLSCWSAAARADAHVISVDMICGITGLGAREEDFAAVRRRFRPGQRLTTITGDSHQAGTLERVKAALAGAPADVLWIDGDHTYEGVKADVEMYGPLVRPGGMIALHDVHGSALCPRSQAHVYWQEIKPGLHTREFIAEPAPGDGMGIGIVFV